LALRSSALTAKLARFAVMIFGALWRSAFTFLIATISATTSLSLWSFAVACTAFYILHIGFGEFFEVVLAIAPKIFIVTTNGFTS